MTAAGRTLPAPRPESVRGRRRGVGTLPWPALAVVALVLLATVAPGLLAPADPLAEDVAQRLQGPSMRHLLGTDQVGRDLLSRVVHGTRATMTTALLALAFALVLSVAAGLVAGYLRGPVDRLLMGSVDVLLALPSLLISLLIVSGLGSGPHELAIAVGLASVPTFTRLVRASVLRISREGFVEAAQSFGVTTPTILWRHGLPFARGPVAALAAVELATIILSVSALSFLGYGVQPPAPEWGNLVAEGRDHFATAWWLTTLPGLVLAVTVVAVHRLGRVLTRDGGGLA